MSLNSGFLQTALVIACGLALPQANVNGQGACCTPDICLDTPNVSACSGFGGVFLDGASCDMQPCGPGACCANLACLNGFSAYDCISGGRDYAGGGTVCADDPCDIGVGACCREGGCSIVAPRECAANDGVFLDFGSQCLSEPCAEGICCMPGMCESSLNFACTAQNGTFIQGGDCATRDACAVEDNCPGDALGSQPVAAVDFLAGLISDDDAGLKRWDRFADVAGAIESLTWFGLDVEFGQGGFSECDDSSNLFVIEFYEDAGSTPGELECLYEFVTVLPEPTGIFLETFQVHRYHIEFDTPCVLTHGWISIQGLGDDCWQAWASSSTGDGTNLCDGCTDPLQPGDLSWCLLGTFGGVPGACCEESSGDCADDVDISACAAVDQRFAADASCAALNPPCAAVSGPCCLPDGSCAVLGEAACADSAGSWLGANDSCDSCPVFGACCIDGVDCVQTTEEACLEETLTFLGDLTSCAECPDPPACPDDTVFAQEPDVPPSFFAGTSEVSSPFIRSDDFSEFGGSIEGLQWFGVDLEPLGSDFIECFEPLDEFQITFREDANGAPGVAVCSYIVLAEKTINGLSYGGTDLNEYSAVLPEPCVLTDGWVSIAGLGEQTCWFLWMSADSSGTSWCEGCPNPLSGSDLSVCLQGTTGGITGACCESAEATCTDGLAIEDCLGAGQSFSADTACAALEPPCGIIEGACCLPNGLCSTSVESTCSGVGGSWLGGDTLCTQCPCTHSCPGGTAPEGEPPCDDDTVDTFNPGCESDEPAFSPIGACAAVCGTSGVSLQGKDFDWYEVQLEASDTLQWTVTAEFEVVAGIVDGNAGCEGLEVLSSGIADACEPLTVSANVEPGTYWLVVQPADVGDVPCGATYDATLGGGQCATACDALADCADRNLDGVRDDNCVWWSCDQGLCSSTAVVFGDVGGPMGSCLPDGAADGNDRFHALSCFANIDTLGNLEAYPCEDQPPVAYNVDAAGTWGNCVPDGYCDANDAYASMNAFEGYTPCVCPSGAAPGLTPPITGRSRVVLEARRPRIRAGRQVEVEVRLADALDDLRGYQLHVAASGGSSGHLELVDMAVHRRRSAAFAAGASWTVFNLATRQMAVGRDGPGTRAPAGTYLATLTFQASADASGVFAVELLQDPDRRSEQRTFLFPTASQARIELAPGAPALVRILPHSHAAFTPPARKAIPDRLVLPARR